MSPTSSAGPGPVYLEEALEQCGPMVRACVKRELSAADTAHLANDFVGAHRGFFSAIAFLRGEFGLEPEKVPLMHDLEATDWDVRLVALGAWEADAPPCSMPPCVAIGALLGHVRSGASFMPLSMAEAREMIEDRVYGHDLNGEERFRAARRLRRERERSEGAAETAQSPQATPRAPRKPRGMSAKEADPLVNQVLKAKPHATIREVAERVRCSQGTVDRTPSWQRAMKRRERRRKVSSMDPQVLAESFGATDETLEGLLEGHRRDLAQEDPTPHMRDRRRSA